MEKRITDWRNKTLSFAGRIQLLKSVLASLHVYWATVFILPQRIIEDIESNMRRFLWSQGDTIKGKAKVAWKDVCYPKSEGGLGLRRLADFNKALMVNHIWSLLQNRESLWVKWIHSYRLKNRSFWDVPVQHNCSWGWRKILQLRQHIRPHLWMKIGDGRSTSVWYDKWDEVCPLINYISTRDVARAGWKLNDTVAEVSNAGVWKWPVAWYDLFPVLFNLPNLHCSPNSIDTLVWKDSKGCVQHFSSTAVWDTIRCKREVIDWNRAVWFPQMIPRHACLMWLIMRGKLRTQDKMMKWSVGGNMNYNLLCCPLCQKGPDSHKHLFFACKLSNQVWLETRHLAQMQHINDWVDIEIWLKSRAKSNSAKSVIGKLLVAANAYYVWQERNNRLFSMKTRNMEQIRDLVATTVRLKLTTMRFKKTAQVESFVAAWNLPQGLVVLDHQRR